MTSDSDVQYRSDVETEATFKIINQRQALVASLPIVYKQIAGLDLDLRSERSSVRPDGLNKSILDLTAIERLTQDTQHLLDLALGEFSDPMMSSKHEGGAAVYLEHMEPLPTQPYSNSRLDLASASRQIRLLILQPGQRGDPIQCNLKVAPSLHDVKYIALSYVWGTTIHPNPVYLDNIPLRITENLYTALQCLRETHEASVFWIDALCIDQASYYEKNAQVRIMGDIFRGAHNVFIFLGEQDMDSDKLLHFLDTESNFLIAQFDLLSGVNGKWHQAAEHLKKNHLDILHSFTRIIFRPWWSRMWVKQEYLLARTAPTICFGERFMSADVFLDHVFRLLSFACASAWFHAIEVSLLSDDQSRSWEDLRERAMLAISAGANNKFTPRTPAQWYVIHSMHVKLLQTFGPTLCDPSICASQCTNPRDKIYAVLALFDPIARAVLQPDYYQSVGYVFLQATIWCALLDNDLQVYLAYNLLEDGSHPSWALDFARPTYVASLEDIRLSEKDIFGNCPSGLKSHCVIHDRIMFVQGLEFATIKRVFHVPASEDDFTILQRLWLLEKFFLEHSDNAVYPRNLMNTAPAILDWMFNRNMGMISALVPNYLSLVCTLAAMLAEFPDFLPQSSGSFGNKSSISSEIIGGLLFDTDNLISQLSAAHGTIQVPQAPTKNQLDEPRYPRICQALLRFNSDARVKILNALQAFSKSYVPIVFDPEFRARFPEELERLATQSESKDSEGAEDTRQKLDHLHVLEQLRESCLLRLKDRHFFLTESGIPGVTAESARQLEEGDKVVFLRKMPGPVILRRCDLAEDMFQMIGIANLRGLQEGSLYELLKGKKRKVFKIR